MRWDSSDKKNVDINKNKVKIKNKINAINLQNGGSNVDVLVVYFDAFKLEARYFVILFRFLSLSH